MSRYSRSPAVRIAGMITARRRARAVAAITRIRRKVLSLKTSRWTIGCLADESHMMPPMMPRKASTAIVTMKGEPNQSSSSPRSIITCRQPRPRVISERPMKSMPASACSLPRRIFDQNEIEKDRDDPDRHVDEEDPAPCRVSVMKPPSVGPRIGATTVAIAATPKAAPRFSGGKESRMIDCWLGCSPPPKKPCNSRNTTSCAKAVRDAAQKRAYREHGEADQEIALAPEQVAEPAGNGQNDAVGDEIGGQRPGRLVVARRKAARDMGQRDVDDGRVEDLHERGERHRHGDEPGIETRLPAAPAASRVAHCTRRPSARPKCRAAAAASDQGRCR